jgi:hypothetical protein
MLPGRLWETNPFSGTSSLALTNGTQCYYVPFWTGDNGRVMGVRLAFPTLQDTAGNQIEVGIYDDSGALWPRALLGMLGAATTTTTGANQAKMVDTTPVVVAPRSVCWIGLRPFGGSAPTVRASTGGHPLVGIPNTTIYRTTSGGGSANGFYVNASSLTPLFSTLDSFQLSQAAPKLAVLLDA